METIQIRGASEHNLKQVNLDLPRNQMIVFTGVSGSGKSSLAFDTLYVEGKRRYMESLSSDARYFLGAVAKPKFEFIRGLSPTIAITKKTPSRNLRSTVGTFTEILDFYRVLYTRIGVLHCYQCLREVESFSAAQIVEKILKWPKSIEVWILAPLVEKAKGPQKAVLSFCQAEGFTRVRINQELVRLDDIQPLSPKKSYCIDLFIDRFSLDSDIRARLTESIETALFMGKGKVTLFRTDSKEEILFSEKNACLYCKKDFPKLEPSCFSFNSPQGMCLDCHGLGVKESTSIPTEEEVAEIRLENCGTCLGSRLRKDLLVRVEKKTITEVTAGSIEENISFLDSLSLSKTQQQIVQELKDSVYKRLRFLKELGVSYLTLDRPVSTLSGGEFQRIHLASQLSEDLSGILYILDEPSTGLHPKDQAIILKQLQRLKERGNSLILVEHDRATIEKADYLVDFGPGAGTAGGEIIYAGTRENILNHPRSLTGQYLCGKKKIHIPNQRRIPDFKKSLRIKNASVHNLKNISVEIPLGLLVCLSGVSGAGKSALIYEVLEPAIQKQLKKKKSTTTTEGSLEGANQIAQVIRVDATPIGKSSKSNPVTYLKIFDSIRDVFTKTHEARIRGYTASRFSFNIKGGRCEVCKGEGSKDLEMHLLPDLEVPCEECAGKRFNSATLEIKYKGSNIAEILAMTLEEASEVFRHHPKIQQGLKSLKEVGLGYLTCGQPSSSLSGGESQRLKLAKELAKPSSGQTLYLMDEPSRGLHWEDIQRLVPLMHQLVEQGNTVVLIEHRLDLIQQADYVIDLGPGGGDQGGNILFCGTPEALAQCPQSITGEYLRRISRREE
ncbi:MAG: ABC-ATPase UvrA [Planctomycetota bacterium]